MRLTNPAAVAALAAGDIDNAIVASTPGGIEAQEARGQQELVASSKLPKETHNTREEFEALGFVFGEDIDDLFVAVKLPDGWSYQATDHSMHNDIVDEQGRKRIGVFYKAAFYDRNASCHLVRRYRVGGDYSQDGKTIATAWDCEKPIKRFGETEYCAEFDKAREQEAAALAWLDKEFPDNKNPLAYW